MLHDLGDYAGAKPLYLRALAISERVNGPDHPSTGARLNNLAMVLLAMGDYAGAKPLFTRALTISERANGPEHPSTGRSLNNLARLLLEMGDSAAARPLFVRALAIAEKANGPEHPSTGRSLNNLAMLLKESGDYAEAKPLFVRALAIAENADGPDHPSTGARLNNLAGLLQDMGDYAGAKPLYLRALSISEKVNGPDHPLTGTMLSNLALLLVDMGDYAGAKPLYVRALSISEKANGPDHALTGTMISNLAGLLQAMGDYPAAKPLFMRALSISERADGPDHPTTGTSLNNLAGLLQAMGDYAGAKPLYLRALAIAEKADGPDHPSTGARLHNLASLLMDMGDYAGAKPLFARALAVSESTVRRGSVGAPRRERLALVATTRSHLASFLSASPRFGSNGYAEALRFKGLVGRLDALDHAVARHAHPDLIEKVESLAAVERRLSAMANAIPPVRDENGGRAWRERYAALSAEREERTRTLAHDFAPFRKAMEGKDPGLAEVQSGLASDEALVDVILSGGHYLAWVVPHEGDVTRVDLGKAQDVEALARAFVEASAAPTGGDGPAAWLAAGRKLREAVVAPLLSTRPDPLRTLYLVPDAALAAVPFEALPGKETGRSLIDETRVVHLSTAQDLVPDETRPRSGTGALLLGGVDYDRADAVEKVEGTPGAPLASAPSLARVDRAPGGRRFEALPATSAEVAAVRERLGDESVVLTGARATEGRLRSNAVGHRILHVATHGFVHADSMKGLRRSGADERRWMAGGADRHLSVGHDPMRLSGLALAGANPREGADADDGILTALEASYLDLEGCDLVVLSACETARGTAESGEGVLGLVHGFQLAGSASVVGSLWSVDDDATRLLMGRFYEGYLRPQHPLSASAALHEAALWLRDSRPGGKDYSAPHYWAAFVCYERR